MRYLKRSKKRYGIEIIIVALFVENMLIRVMQMLILLKDLNGGLGVEENIVTLCRECHYKEDFGQDTKLYEQRIEDYLKSKYGLNWNKEKLIYKKY